MAILMVSACMRVVRIVEVEITLRQGEGPALYRLQVPCDRHVIVRTADSVVEAPRRRVRVRIRRIGISAELIFGVLDGTEKAVVRKRRSPIPEWDIVRLVVQPIRPGVRIRLEVIEERG